MYPIATGPTHVTANDRFKHGFSTWFWIALILATVAHFLLFLATPSFAVEDVSFDPENLDLVAIPDRIEVPPPPPEVARPAAPVVTTDALLDTDVTIPPTTIGAHPAETLVPPTGKDPDAGMGPVFTPYTVAPRLLNPRDVARALERLYPPLLRDAGIGATVEVWFYIDETGRVVRTQIDEPSGYDAFDQAALAVADRMEFSPALNLDRRVPVWVSMPIRFEVRR